MEPDRPALADEVEITPEMIAAGVNALCDYSLARDRAANIVEAVYAAMAKASPAS